MMSNFSNFKKLEKLVCELCGSVDYHIAQTGTIYMEISRGEAIFTIRIANHADAHGHADYTADGVEGTTKGARAFIFEMLRTSEPALRRLRRARKNKKKRDDAAFEAERAAYMARRALGPVSEMEQEWAEAWRNHAQTSAGSD